MRLDRLGITVGFRRLPHPPRRSRGGAAAHARRARGPRLDAAVEGPVISWVADHRKHHAFADTPGDPTARTSTTASACAARCADCCTRTSAGCSTTRSAAARRAMPPT